MNTPAPIDKSFVPHTKRPVLARNAGLFVDSTSRARGAMLVAPQSADCAGKPNGTPCGYYANMFCCDGECKFGRDC